MNVLIVSQCHAIWATKYSSPSEYMPACCSQGEVCLETSEALGEESPLMGQSKRLSALLRTSNIEILAAIYRSAQGPGPESASKEWPEFPGYAGNLPGISDQIPPESLSSSSSASWGSLHGGAIFKVEKAHLSA